jgi:hypothetical protein
MANPIQFSSGHSSFDMGGYMIQNFASQAASLAHTKDVFFCSKYTIHALIINDLDSFDLASLPKI